MGRARRPRWRAGVEVLDLVLLVVIVGGGVVGLVALALGVRPQPSSGRSVGGVALLLSFLILVLYRVGPRDLHHWYRRPRVVDLREGNGDEVGCAELTVRRPVSTVGLTDRYLVHVDGQVRARLWAGSVVTFRLAPGQVAVRASKSVLLSDELTITLCEGDRASLQLWNVSSLGEVTSQQTLQLQREG